VPPNEVIRLDTAGNYPATVVYHDQRRVFAGPLNDPQGIYFTRVGTESNLTVELPVAAERRVSIRLKAQQQNTIRHLVPLTDLLALTASGIWRVFSTDDGAMTPDTMAARPQSFDGASEVRPLLTGSAVVFVENTGKRVRDISYSTEARGYITDDRSILAPHLFNDYTLVDAAFQRNPDKIAWFVRSDGALLSLTYMPEQQVYAWAQHVTDGFFESVCVVPERQHGRAVRGRAAHARGEHLPRDRAHGARASSPRWATPSSSTTASATWARRSRRSAGCGGSKAARWRRWPTAACTAT
jgi:hypothetical protein